MKLAVMQPYFFPYVGYFQLIGAVDLFIVYDNIKYTKKGWINRNRILQHGKEAFITLPLKKASDFSDIRQRELASDFRKEQLLNVLRAAYHRAPYFKATFPIIEEILSYDNRNLFFFLYNSIVSVCRHLQLTTKLEVSSAVQEDNSLKKEERVTALCKQVQATVYINPIGGINLYTKEYFQTRGVGLKFLQPRPFHYEQFANEFVPWLSIIDVLMFNSVRDIRHYLVSGYELI